MSDKLSAASLLLAIVAVLYGMWYPLIMSSLETSVPQFAANRRKPLKEVLGVRNRRAIPLTFAAIAVALVFLPDAVSIIIQSLRLVAGDGLQSVQHYDSVSTAFILVELVSLYFAFHFMGVIIKFRDLIAKLSEPDASGTARKE
jgi:hypothetical protein